MRLVWTTSLASLRCVHEQRVHIHTDIYIYIYIYVCMYVCMYAYRYRYICICICICIYGGGVKSEACMDDIIGLIEVCA